MAGQVSGTVSAAQAVWGKREEQGVLVSFQDNWRHWRELDFEKGH